MNGRPGGVTSGPRHRAPLAVRVVAGLCGLTAILFAGALMLSDRAPRALQTTFGDAAERLWARVDADRRAELRAVIGAGSAPETDDIVHVLVWASVVGLCALAVWTWRGVAVSAAAVLLLSVAVELAQGRWSSTRAVEASDVVANALGVAAGATVALVVLAVGDALGRLRAPRRATRHG